MTDTGKPEINTDAKTHVVEKRVGSAVIRRRREAPVAPLAQPPIAPGAEAAAATTATPDTAQSAAVTPATGTPSARPGAPAAGITAPKVAGRVAGEEPAPAAKLAKPLRRKKSREEWVEDDIRRAGGLRHYAAEDLVVGEEETPVVVAGVAVEAGSEPVAAASDAVAEEIVTAEPEVVAEPEAEPVPIVLPTPSPAATPEVTLRAPATRVDRVFRPSGGMMRKKRQMRRGGEGKKAVVIEMKAAKRVIRIDQQITVSELSQRLGVKGSDLLRQLMGLGIMVTINHTVDLETATLLAGEYGFSIEYVGVKEDQLLAAKAPITKAEAKDAAVSAQAVVRPPVVTVMGHVDHGKTSILDAVRKTDVATGEAGGITQHIGASEVTVGDWGVSGGERSGPPDLSAQLASPVQANRRTITFLDTPGHEAFTALRARGALVTDLVVLVVAADDGVMPQTIEAIDHAKAAGVPIIVAINKMDTPDANPDRIKRQLSEHGVVPEDWGGEAACLPVSAKTGEGIATLLDHILLQAEVLELKSDPALPASGTVIEARLDKGRGPVVTVLIQSGTLRKGAPIVCGTCAGKVRALVGPRGDMIDAVGPGQAAEIQGLGEVPVAGDALIEATDERAAKTVADARARKLKDEQQTKGVRFSLEDLTQQLETAGRKELTVIIKADVQGSAEAVVAALARLGTDAVAVKVVHHGVGGISESDVMLAVASKACIIGFNIAAESKARQLAEQEGVQITRYKIIYELIDDVKKAMTGILEPHRTEKVLGRADVREVFNISKVGAIAGCAVVEGKVQRSARARLLRDSAVVFEGKVASLKHFKDDAREVQAGQECGIGLEGYHDMKPGDAIESYIVEETAATL